MSNETKPVMKPDMRNRAEQDPEKIRLMFDRISPTYDLLNRTLTLGIDKRWRRAAIRALGALGGARCLDICCGTGDMTFELARLSGNTFAEIQALDFSAEMLKYAGARLEKTISRSPELTGRITFQQGDAEQLPFADNQFATAMVAFGIRNVRNIPRALSEAARVLKPGGRFAILEFSMPTSKTIHGLYRFYFRQILPRIGAALSGDAEAYRYLNQSAEVFPSGEEFAAVIRESGFSAVEVRPLSFGLVTVYLALV